MKVNYLLSFALFLTLLLVPGRAEAQKEKDYTHEFDQIDRKFEHIFFHDRLSDLAHFDIVRLTGPARSVPRLIGNEFRDTLANNDLQFYSYVFIPKTVKQGKKYPLIVFSHGGVHLHFAMGYIHILRELLTQGYIVIAPDYRGSTGYGKKFYEAIDYGGRENDDVLAARDYMVESYSIVDSTRVGLLGWSHGGMISLMNILQWPEKYTCAFAGVPVSDVTYRLSYMYKTYANDFTPKYHIGGTPQEKPEEYARRSPVTYAKNLCRPLMITTCINDDTVSVKEVERMIEALKAHNKEFEYKIYPPMPGSHVFDRIDTMEASDIRFKTYKFLEKYLNPPHKFKSEKDVRKAGYMFY